MMDGATSISSFMSPPLSLSPSSNLNFVHLDANQFIDDGATYCIYDASSEYQIVLQGDVAESEALAFAVGGEEAASMEVFRFDPTKGVLELAHNNQDSTQLKIETEQLPVPVEYIAAEETNENMPQQTHQQQSDPLTNTLPTFYNDMAITLSSDSETHETYLPLSFDEASHFLFHGREECVITTDIPIPTSEPFCLLAPPSSTGNDALDVSSSNASVIRRTSKKKKVPMPRSPPSPSPAEGLTINRKVFKCPHKDCKFWAARGHRFHEHMCTHDTVRPFGCSECTYETNWKSDVKKHIARMIQRNSKDHENAVLTRIAEKKVDSDCYKEYLIDLDVPCNIFSGRVGEPGRCSNSSSKKAKKRSKNQETNGAPSTEYNDLSSSTVSSTSSTLGTPPPKESRRSRSKKRKTNHQPIIMITQIVEADEAEQAVSNPVPAPPEIPLPQLESTTEGAEATTLWGVPAADEGIETVEIKDPALKSTVTTEGGITVKIFTAENAIPQPVCVDSKKVKVKIRPSPNSSKESKRKVVSKKSTIINTEKTNCDQIWKCTNCDFTHSDKFNMLNHMLRFHKLHGTDVKPTLVNCRAGPTMTPKSSFVIDEYSEPIRDVIVRKPGENFGNFQQYFLVVENGRKEVSSPRRVRQPEKGNLQCDMCPFVGPDGHVLAQHKEFHGSLNENFTYVCPYCNFKSATRKDMEQHKHLHTQSNGKQPKVQDYSRVNIKRSENGHGDTSTLISKP